MLAGQKRKTPQNLRSTAILSATFARLLPTTTQRARFEDVSRQALVKALILTGLFGDRRRDAQTWTEFLRAICLGEDLGRPPPIDTGCAFV